MRRLLLVMLAVGAVAAPAAGAYESATFKTPSGNIVCAYSQWGSRESVRCDIRSGMTPKPSRPRGCNLDYGQGLSVSGTGRGRVTCAGDTILGMGGRALLYGTTFRRGRIACTSSKAGLRCTNKEGHGFFLSRERWSVS